METAQDILTEWKGHLGCWKEQGLKRPDTYSQAMIVRLDEALLREREAQEGAAGLSDNGSLKDLPMDKVVQLAESSIANLTGSTRAVWERILSEIKHGMFAKGTTEFGVQVKAQAESEDCWRVIERNYGTADEARQRAALANRYCKEDGIEYRPAMRMCSPWCEIAPKQERKEV